MVIETPYMIAVFLCGFLSLRGYLVDELRVSYSSVIVFGRSLGSGPAIFLASQHLGSTG